MPALVPLIASHLTSEPNALVGWVFVGIVATVLFLLVTSVEERRAMQISAAGWGLGIVALVAF